MCEYCAVGVTALDSVNETHQATATERNIAIFFSKVVFIIWTAEHVSNGYNHSSNVCAFFQMLNKFC